MALQRTEASVPSGCEVVHQQQLLTSLSHGSALKDGSCRPWRSSDSGLHLFQSRSTDMPLPCAAGGAGMSLSMPAADLSLSSQRWLASEAGGGAADDSAFRGQVGASRYGFCGPLSTTRWRDFCSDGRGAGVDDPGARPVEVGFVPALPRGPRSIYGAAGGQDGAQRLGQWYRGPGTVASGADQVGWDGWEFGGPVVVDQSVNWSAQ
ncbi:MAG: hypothetical protein GY847_20270, partial [Proteobacteria bacterium]|nr:hypothetical protein [Pseudomonadota bacterium]